MNNIKKMSNAIRILSADAIEKAKSGHPGLPLGMADVATVLYSNFFNHNPLVPTWPNRDRFVLSAGHGSMLLYSLLYLTGYPSITLEQIKNFRQVHSLTPGHPEVGITPGVETTTGPLGQGLGNAVGMAMAERILKSKFGKDLINNTIYCLVGDGCLMEGISQESISLAGHYNLDNLVVFWDSNKITIDGNTDLANTECMVGRFKSANWNTYIVDGHNINEINKIITEAKITNTKPSLIICNTVIGYGSPSKQGTEKAHGAPLGEEDIIGLRRNLNWEYQEPFYIPENILQSWKETTERGVEKYNDWMEIFNSKPKDVQDEFLRIFNKELPTEWNKGLLSFKLELSNQKPIWATRKASGEVIKKLEESIPELIGGSADLTESVNTKTPTMVSISKDNWGGNYIHWGIREHGMAAAMNGMALYGGVIPYSGTFLSFVDYMRPSVRLAALMKQKVIFVLTHDSIGVGEDGPTHQPTEILAGLRIIPNLRVFRPCDPIETVECWELALQYQGPSVLILTRQAVPFIRKDFVIENLCAKGAYLISDSNKVDRDVTFFSTGSEVNIALRAMELLKNEGIESSVISMPCWEIFDEQPYEYKEHLLNNSGVNIAVEASISPTWDKYIGTNGAFIGLKDFGLSGPANILYEYFGITAEKVADTARQKIQERKKNLELLGKLIYNGRKY